jgi:prepilin-type N-terminal cleavage/methylation domain-containing protein
MDKNNFLKKTKLGFTLVELIVVIAIIGLLVTLSLLALSNARMASRDSKRMADIKQLQTALELFYDAQDRYPTNAEFQSGSLSYYNANVGTTTYISIPTPPAIADGSCSDAQNAYSYNVSADGSTYTINFCTAKPVSDLPGGKLIGIPGGIVAGCYPEDDVQFCVRQNKNCSVFTGTDNCGQPKTANCGTCSFPLTCGTLAPNQCGCTPEADGVFCSRLSANCGSLSGTDNCGHSRTVADCGVARDTSCISPLICAGGGATNQCGCAPEDNSTFCSRLGAACGSLTNTDNCGQSRTVADCGLARGTSCTGYQTCGAVSPNQCDCAPETDPAFCTRLGAVCGSLTGTDNCGQSRTVAACGSSCSFGYRCNINSCVASTWTVVPNSGMSGTCSISNWQSMASSADGQKLAAGISNGYIYTSIDSGATWIERISSGARNWISIASSDDGVNLVAAANNDYIYTSTDSGATWVQRTPAGAGTIKTWYSVSSSYEGRYLVAGASGDYVYTSSDFGASWIKQTPAGAGVTKSWYTVSSSSDGKYLVAGAYYEYVYTNDNYGNGTWTKRTPAGAGVPKNWYSVSSSNNGVDLVAVPFGGYIYTSTSSGAIWATSTSLSKNWYSVSSSGDGSKVVAAAYGGYLYTSTNYGVDWTSRATTYGTKSWQTVAYSDTGQKLAAAAIGDRVYTSIDDGVNWTPRTNVGSRDWRSIASSLDNTKLAAVVYGGYIYTSVDSGATWTERTGSGAKYWRWITSSADGTHLAAAAYGDYVYTSSDSGLSWIQRSPAGAVKNWDSVSSSGDGINLIAAARGDYVYTNNNYGIGTWTKQMPAGAVVKNWNTVSSSGDGSHLVATVDSGYIYTSINGTWSTSTLASMSPLAVYSYSSDNSYYLVAAGNSTNISTSANQGVNWIARNSGAANWSGLSSSDNGNRLGACVAGGYIYLSPDFGVTWPEQTAAGRRNWYSVTLSSDGSKAAAVAKDGNIWIYR